MDNRLHSEAQKTVRGSLERRKEKPRASWRKDTQACVVGSLQTRSYNDSNGEKKYVTEIMADEVEFLSPKDEDNHQSQRQPERGGQRGGQQRRRPALQEFDDDGDIPF